MLFVCQQNITLFQDYNFDPNHFFGIRNLCIGDYLPMNLKLIYHFSPFLCTIPLGEQQIGAVGWGPKGGNNNLGGSQIAFIEGSKNINSI